MKRYLSRFVTRMFVCALLNFLPACALSPAQGQSAKTTEVVGKTIMAMGDSITLGYSGAIGYPSGDFGVNYGGYRGVLQTELYKNGCGFDFVGRNILFGQLMGDKEHEGYGGYTVSDLYNVAQTALPQFQPDIVLFMGGTNDLYFADTATALAAAHKLSETIQLMFSLKPNLSLYVAIIPPVNNFTYPDNKVDLYNSLMPDIATYFSAHGFNLTLVDQYTALANAVGPLQENWFTYFDDGEHPLEAGYQMIARAWRDAILAHGDCARPASFEIANLPIKTDVREYGLTASDCLINTGRKPGEEGYDPFVRNKTNYGTTFRLQNILYPRGLGQQAFSRQCFNVSPVCNTFHAQIGLDDVSPGPFAEFRVFADGALIYLSPPMMADSETLSVDIPLPPNAKMIALEAGPDTGSSAVYADWVNASMLCPAVPTPTPSPTPTRTSSPTPTPTSTPTRTPTFTPTPTPTPKRTLFLPLVN